MKKYEFSGEIKVVNGIMLHRIKALKDFGDVKKGDLGGWIEKESNLGQNGNCWIYDEACAYGNASIHNNAKIYDNAQIYDEAMIYDQTVIYDNARIFNHARVFGLAKIIDNAKVYDCAYIHGDCIIGGNATISNWVDINDNICICNNAEICSNQDYLIFKNVGQCNENVVAFKTSDNNICIKKGCYCKTLSEFELEINKKCKEEKTKKYAFACIEAIKIHFDIKEEDFYVDNFRMWAYEQYNEYIKNANWKAYYDESSRKIAVLNYKTKQVGFSYCHPNDITDDKIGVGVAYARATGKKIPKEKKKIIKKLRDLKQGDCFIEPHSLDNRKCYFMGINPYDDYFVIYVDEFTKETHTIRSDVEAEIIE